MNAIVLLGGGRFRRGGAEGVEGVWFGRGVVGGNVGVWGSVVVCKVCRIVRSFIERGAGKETRRREGVV